MDYQLKYLKYKAKYYKLLEQTAGNKTIDQIKSDVKICVGKAGTDDSKIKNV
jgi:hypothetical protein